MPTSNDIVVAIKSYIDKLDRPEIIEADVVSVKGTSIQILIDGSSVSQQAISGGKISLNPGDRCVCIRTNRTAKWIVLSSFSKSGLGSSNSGSLSGSENSITGTSTTRVSPPNNFRSLSIEGCTIFAWDAPYQVPVSFEVQTNSIGSDIGATTAIITRGSYYFLPTTSNTYAKVRSIDLGFNKSSWTNWILGAFNSSESDNDDRLLIEMDW